ncbi:hypothetical protein ACLB2K_029664 [Fragaria x ananassa]
MASFQSTQDMGSVPSLEQIFQMFAELKSQNLATQQSVADLTRQETKGLVEGRIQRIRVDVDQNTDAVKQHVEILSRTCTTVDEQTRCLNGHDTKLQDQHNASFFGSKNSLEKLDEFKKKHDRLSVRILEVEDWVRAQAPKNLTLEPAGASANEGTSKYIPPNERPRGNPKVGAQKTPQLALGVDTSKNLP